MQFKFRFKRNTDKSMTNNLSGEVSAAIFSAIHLYFNELREPEGNVTAVNMKKIYMGSPWSDKYQYHYQNNNKK